MKHESPTNCSFSYTSLYVFKTFDLCFIFLFQLIEYQTFQKLKHTTFMFHS